MTVGHKLLLVAEATVGFFDAFIPHCFQKFVIPAGQKPLRRRCFARRASEGQSFPLSDATHPFATTWHNSFLVAVLPRRDF